MYKIAIIGGGANGVSVLNELVNQLSETDHPVNVEITLYEKSGVFGAGLAYGTNLDAHILNMPASTMSAIGDDPEHFHEWLKKPHKPNLHPYFNAQAGAKDFVPRKIFGMYLEELYQNALKQAEDHGINIEIFNEEALDVTENKDSVVVWSDGKSREFNQTVLCLGNQPPTFGRELKGVPGYFHHAWPEKNITDNIPNDEEVYVIGSSLTAVDVFITLQEKGHSGPIHFVSRQGVLPKVRVFAEPYKLEHLTHENIRSLTDNGKKSLSLEQVSELFVRELENAGVDVTDTSSFLSISTRPALEVLKHDIDMADNGNMAYFSVLKAVDEVIGHIWNAIPLKDREHFDAHYKTLWNAYDYPMPMQNARKILGALESGQLSVDSGFRKLEYDTNSKDFLLTFSSKDKTRPPIVHKTKYVINATGQGLNLDRLESPIIQNTLERGTITPHLLGGLEVDFDSGAVENAQGHYSERIYAVGSLTRGVHFYTNSINENAKCGKRTVDAIIKRAKNHTMNLDQERTMNMETTGEKKPKNIALFFGSDVSSHLLMNELIPSMIEEGYRPSVYFAKHHPSKKPILPEIQTQGFFERGLLAEHIYPFLDSQPIQTEAPCHSPNQIAEIYDITVKEIDDINDPSFIEELDKDGIEAGVVVRCYQKFGKDIIRFFNQDSHNALWNLHPGILPQYRGVMTYFRSMSDEQEKAGYSLHVIDEDWDAGPVIDIRPETLDCSKAMLTNYCEIASSGVPIILDNLNKLANRETISTVPQSEEEKGYYTFPTRAEMDKFLSKGFSLVDPEYMRQAFLTNFSQEGTTHQNQLAKTIDDAIYNKLGISYEPEDKPDEPRPI